MELYDNEKKVEAITSAEVVPDLGTQVHTNAERISAYFTIAAAAAGLISDGCDSTCTTASKAGFRLIIQ